MKGTTEPTPLHELPSWPDQGRHWGQRLLVVMLSTLLGLGLWLPAPVAWAQVANTSEQSIQPYLDRVAEAISEFTLDNGMKFIVLERHQAPVVSFMIYADVGAVNETDGRTGVAHYLEHLAFKGTSQIGTKDYAAEQQLFAEMDTVFAKLMAAEKAGDEAAMPPNLRLSSKPSSNRPPAMLSKISTVKLLTRLAVSG
jgi:hypothetical protein